MHLIKPRVPRFLVNAVPLLLLFTVCQSSATELSAVPAHADGIYKTGEKVSWTISAPDNCTVKAVVKQNDSKVLWDGTVVLTDGKGRIETRLDEPGMILTTISTNQAKWKTVMTLGAAVDPFNIPVSAPRPDDFDAFWNAKIKRLKSIPPNPVITKEECGDSSVCYEKLTLDNIDATRVYGQLAKPAKEGKFPAMLIVQWAGVYGLPRDNVVNPAKKGWLALNIMAHDLPFDQPKEFYDKASATSLKNYTSIGNESRETSYFLRMFLGCYRAADYLAVRPEWDGKTLVVTGTSQGGLQGLVTAGLHPAITAVLVNVPAGCDTTGPWTGRSVAWPYWFRSTQGKDEKSVMETSRYFDAVNFACNIRCPALVAIGMIDQTSTPAGVMSAFNRIQGPKEAVLMLNSPHQNRNNSQKPWHERSNAWLDELVKGNPPPVINP